MLNKNNKKQPFEGVLKICSKFTGEQPRRSVISIKLQSDYIEITLRHGCSPVNLLNIFRTPFSYNTSGWLLLNNVIAEVLDLQPKIILIFCKQEKHFPVLMQTQR